MVQSAAYLDTICAPASGLMTGGAVSLLRLSGPSALDVCDSLVKFRNGTASSSPGWKVKYGEALSKDGAVLDQVMVSLYRAPHSYTGEDVVEICCHASPYIVSSLLERICSLGARMAEPGEFTRRAFLNGKMDLAQAESVADLIASSSEAAHRVAINQLKGGYSEELRELRGKLLEMSALLELELDFSEEDVEFASRERLSELLSLCIGKVSSLCASFRAGNAVKNGVPVAIVGAPNSGKSTLLNRLVGSDRAIVSSAPGTTRDTIEETMVLGGLLYRFIDTAGIRETSDTIESMGVARSLETVKRASLVICVVDGISADTSVLESLNLESWQKLLVVESKADSPDFRGIVLTAAGAGSAGFSAAGAGSAGFSTAGSGGVFRISALTGFGMEALLECIRSFGHSLVSGDDRAASAGPGRTYDRAASAGPGRTFLPAQTGEASQTIVTNARHADALRRALQDLQAVRDGLVTGLPSDLLAEDLRSALSHLGSITGEITSDEVLGEIFGRFCIGK